MEKHINLKLIISSVTIFISIIGFGQEIDVNSEIRKDFTDYFNLISEKKIESALDYSNPKLFELIPRDEMKSLMEAVYKMPNIEYKTGNLTFLKFDELKKIENDNYVKFYIISPIEMKFKDIENTEEQISKMTKNFETKFGVGNVNFDKETGFYKINAEKII
ncbi:MAG TPA: hypothetical protein DCM02_03225, partial [Flavobacterium sp.]|nr:hypothetical protein [Flavobacterium sp.]